MRQPLVGTLRGERSGRVTMPVHRSGTQYVESLLSQVAGRADDYQVESTLWHDGRVRVVLRREGVTFFAFSFYPAIVNKDEPRDAVYIEFGAEFMSARGGSLREVTVDDR